MTTPEATTFASGVAPFTASTFLAAPEEPEDY